MDASSIGKRTIGYTMVLNSVIRIPIARMVEVIRMCLVMRIEYILKRGMYIHGMMITSTHSMPDIVSVTGLNLFNMNMMA
jgi:hypothetical protein